MTPQNNQSMGLFIGNGDQDNYVKLALLDKPRPLVRRADVPTFLSRIAPIASRAG